MNRKTTILLFVLAAMLLLLSAISAFLAYSYGRASHANATFQSHYYIGDLLTKNNDLSFVSVMEVFVGESAKDKLLFGETAVSQDGDFLVVNGNLQQHQLILRTLDQFRQVMTVNEVPFHSDNSPNPSPEMPTSPKNADKDD